MPDNRGECDDCDEMMAWAIYVKRAIEIGKALTDDERKQFEKELQGGDSLAKMLANEIRRFKSGRWGTWEMHERALARLREHEEWKRLWKPLPGMKKRV